MIKRLKFERNETESAGGMWIAPTFWWATQHYLLRGFDPLILPEENYPKELRGQRLMFKMCVTMLSARVNILKIFNHLTAWKSEITPVNSYDKILYSH